MKVRVTHDGMRIGTVDVVADGLIVDIEDNETAEASIPAAIMRSVANQQGFGDVRGNEFADEVEAEEGPALDEGERGFVEGTTDVPVSNRLELLRERLAAVDGISVTVVEGSR